MRYRYQRDAWDVLQLARAAAVKLESAEIGAEHLLLGLLRKDPILASLVFERQPAQLGELEELIRRHADSGGPPEWSAQGKACLAYAAGDAEQRGDEEIEIRHLVIGILAEPNPVIATFLKGVELKALALLQGLQVLKVPSLRTPAALRAYYEDMAVNVRLFVKLVEEKARTTKSPRMRERYEAAARNVRWVEEIDLQQSEAMTKKLVN